MYLCTKTSLTSATQPSVSTRVFGPAHHGLFLILTHSPLAEVHLLCSSSIIVIFNGKCGNKLVNIFLYMTLHATFFLQTIVRCRVIRNGNLYPGNLSEGVTYNFWQYEVNYSSTSPFTQLQLVLSCIQCSYF